MIFLFLSEKQPQTIATPIEPKEDAKALPFHKKKYLMTQTEHKFFDVLKEIIQDKYIIIPQVALSRIIETQNTQQRYGSDSWYSNFNRINKKSVDFVIFDKEFFTPLLVIELDDYTHNYYNRKRRDEFLDKILKTANLNILHIKTNYNFVELKQLILNNLPLCSP